jgi:RimK family alpha-L-glutamate ligase
MKQIWMFHNSANNKDYSTQRLLTEFNDRNISASVFQPKNFDIITSRKSPKSIRYQGEKIKLPDAVLVRTGADTNYFTLALLRQLEGFDIPIINSCQSIINTKDKMLSSQLLAKSNLPTPRTMLVSFPVNVNIVEQEIGFPCVVKLVTGSQGKGVYLCKDRNFFVDLMELIDNLKTKKFLIIQEFINSGELFDLRVWVIGDTVKLAMKRTPPEGDFKANISHGGQGQPFDLTDEIIDVSQRTAECFGLDITGIDLLYDGKKYLVCEANSSPGFEGIDRFCNVDMATDIVDYIETKI